MKKTESQPERIARFESAFDQLSAAVRQLSAALDAWEALQPALDALTAYYEGDSWKADFADDEAGLIPAEVKRGVLSEDGVYNLLEEIRATEERMRTAPARKQDQTT